MSAERTNCPNCESPCEIAAVKFRIGQRTSMLFVCPLCGFALVEAPIASTSWAKLFLRIGMALALVTIIPVIFFIVMQVSVFDHQPTRTGRLATAAKTTTGHLNDPQTHHLF